MRRARSCWVLLLISAIILSCSDTDERPPEASGQDTVTEAPLETERVVALAPVQAPRWDINGDRVVDIFDLVLCSQHFGETYEADSPQWDVNADGQVDIFDLVLVSGHFGETYPDSPPGIVEDIAGYQNWLRLNAAPIPPAPGGDPHRGTKNVYVNQVREAIAPDGQQQFPYPNGSVVVKEAVRPDRDFIGLIAIMRKVQDADPAHNDWVFVEYVRNEADEAFREIASDATCWGCHAGAAGTDYVFTTLE